MGLDFGQFTRDNNVPLTSFLFGLVGLDKSMGENRHYIPNLRPKTSNHQKTILIIF